MTQSDLSPSQGDPGRMLSHIRASLAAMSPAERKIGEAMLSNVQAVISWSLADAARIAGVSEPSVIRFCRRLGFSGYSEFRMKFAQAIVLLDTRGALGQPAPATDGHPAQDALAETCTMAISAINELMLDFDRDAIERAGDTLARARRVDIYGHGASGFLAGETQLHLTRYGIAAAAYSDPALQMFSSLSLGPEDAVLVFSFSGVTTFPMQNIDIARARGAPILSLCPTGSPIAAVSDIHVPVNTYRQKNPETFLSGERLTMTVMIDTLVKLVSERISRTG